MYNNEFVIKNKSQINNDILDSLVKFFALYNHINNVANSL